ncbi:MAG: M28 family peptidase, partial [Candidatus Acidiferrales bacterium]
MPPTMTSTRREFLSNLSLLAIGASAPRRFLFEIPAPALRINADRLQQSLEGLSVYGRPAGGAFSDGVSRVAFTDADFAGRNYAMQLMKAAGMDPRIDSAGNIFGSRKGTDPNLKPILFGSHIDSVPSGGNFDGDVGSMSSIEIMRTLKENVVSTRHPLQMAIWSDEEGGLTGSSAAVGELQPKDLN